MDVQFCPFKAAGESAGQDAKHKHTAKPQPQKKIMRRATTSLITPEHKGILTVTLISATNLTVRSKFPTMVLPQRFCRRLRSVHIILHASALNFAEAAFL